MEKESWNYSWKHIYNTDIDLPTGCTQSRSLTYELILRMKLSPWKWLVLLIPVIKTNSYGNSRVTKKVKKKRNNEVWRPCNPFTTTLQHSITMELYTLAALSCSLWKVLQVCTYVPLRHLLSVLFCHKKRWMNKKEDTKKRSDFNSLYDRSSEFCLIWV